MDPILSSIADSLAMEDIPVKLRCAACNKLATNAFRTPCCDQSICENCQSSLPQACPICLHEPVKGEDCRPNRTLRMTIKAFLKKLMTEREKAQKKQAVEHASITPAAVQSAPGEQPSSAAPGITTAAQSNFQNGAPQGSQEVGSKQLSTDPTKPSTASETLPTEAQKDVPQPSIETTEDHVREDSFQEQAREEAAALEQTGAQNDGSQPLQNQQNAQTQGSGQQWLAANGVGQGMNGGGLGFDGMNNGFPNMGFANPGDLSAMMQFMPNNAMNGFPNMIGMPGMPGMGMDAMQAMSQSMFGGFGGPGMGINGMNAGMGFPAGQGWNGGFNGQPGSWMSGQDKFNQNAYGGHANGMGGDFGANAGYAGYNMPSQQGNYNQMNHHQFPSHDFQNGYHGQGFHNRGRGRGRGYSYSSRGRGGYNQVMSGNHTNHEPFHHQYPQHQDNSYPQNSQQPQESEDLVDEFGRDKTKHAKAEEATDEQIAREMAPGDADESPEAPAAAVLEDTKVTTDVKSEPQNSSVKNNKSQSDSNKNDADNERQANGWREEARPAPIQTFISDEQSQEMPTQPTSAVANGNTMMPPPSPATVQPTHPSSHVEGPYDYNARSHVSSRGLPRGPSDPRGFGRGRGSAHLPDETTNHIRHGSHSSSAPITTPIEPKGLGVEGAPKGPKAMREGLPNTGIRGGRGFSIVGRASSAAHGRPNGNARSRSRSPTRSRSPSRHRSRHHRSHRHRSPSASDSSEHERERERRRERHRRRSHKHDPSDEEKESRASPTHRSSHRSRRDRSQDRDEDGHSTHRRSHRSRRERDHEGESRSTRRRSRTPPTEESINHSNNKITDPSSTSSSRKRREREYDREEEEDYEQQRRERKRSRRDYEYADEAAHPSTSHTITSEKQIPSSSSALRNSDSQQQSSRHHHHHQSNHNISNNHNKTSTNKESNSSLDPHELERQARNKERLQKELQRREAMEGKGVAGGGGGRKSGGAAGGGGALGRRVSYKYEDELEGHDRVEREREAGRWA